MMKRQMPTIGTFALRHHLNFEALKTVGPQGNIRTPVV